MPKHVDPNAVTLRAVRPGDTFSKLVEGGCVRAAALAPGVVVESVDRDCFISVEQLIVELAKLGYAVIRVEAEVAAKPDRVRIAKGGGRG